MFNILKVKNLFHYSVSRLPNAGVFPFQAA